MGALVNKNNPRTETTLFDRLEQVEQMMRSDYGSEDMAPLILLEQILADHFEELHSIPVNDS